jgi:hypothetical protein
MKEFAVDLSFWRLILASLPVFISNAAVAYWYIFKSDIRVASHDTFQWALIRIAFFLIIVLDRAPFVDEIMRLINYGSCDAYQLSASILVSNINLR